MSASRAVLLGTVLVALVVSGRAHGEAPDEAVKVHAILVANTKDPDIGKSVAFSPTPDGFLGLPIVQDLYPIRVCGVVRKPKGIGFVRTVSEVATPDPCSCDRAPVIAKTKALGDFYEIGRAAHLQACPPRAGFQIGVAR